MQDKTQNNTYGIKCVVAIILFTYTHLFPLQAENDKTSRIDLMSNEDASNIVWKHLKTKQANNSTFDCLTLEMGSQFNLADSRYNSNKLNLILGEQLSTNSQLGFGIGYRYFPQTQFKAAALSIDYRMLVGKKNLKPYFAMNLGTFIHYSGYKQRFVLSGIASSPSLGIQLKIDPKTIVHYGILLDIIFPAIDYYQALGINCGITF
jgi:hypothetical protein